MSPAAERPKTVRTTRVHTIEDIQGDHITLSHEEVANGRGNRSRYRKERGKRMFMMVMSEELLKADITLAQHKLLHALLIETSVETHLAPTSVTKLAEVAGLHRVTAQNAMTDLLERQFVFRVEGRYRISAWLGFRGNLDDWDDLEMYEPHPQYQKPLVDA